MKSLSLILLAAIASLAVAPAVAEDLRGDAFITAMAGNTLTGKSSDGTKFSLYFLPGGAVTYQDVDGKTEAGAWKLDKEGDVCVDWSEPTKAKNGCFRVKAEGMNATWANKSGAEHGGLRGEVEPLILGPKVQ